MQASISLAGLLLGLAASSPATVLAMPFGFGAGRGRGGTCNGQKQLDCPSQADVCFNNVGQVVQGGGGSDWSVSLTQCIKGSAISFITWSDTDANGDCLPCPPTNKLEEIPAGSTFLSGLTVPFGSCTGKPICVYVHDGQFQVGKDGSPNSEVAAGCFSSPNQLCAMCAYKVTPQVPAGGACDDGTACTVNDVCAADGTCSGAPSDAACEDNIACTTNTCSPGDATADVSGCTISYDNSACADNIACTDDVCVGGRDAAPLGIQPGDNFNNGCGYTATANPANACNDGFTCTTDSCVALPSVSAALGDPAGTGGCFFDKTNPGCTPRRACAVGTCVADPANALLPGSGCTYTEVVAASGEGFCADKYTGCSLAVCADADGGGEIAGGTTFDDGCSVAAQADANAQCSTLESSPECGTFTCTYVGAGTGCTLSAGNTAANNAQCSQGQDCEFGTCGDDGNCALNQDNGFCTDRYAACASPTCAGATGNQADGCNTAMPTAAQAFCVSANPLNVGAQCGSYTCTPGPFTPGQLPTDAGCTFADDASVCNAGSTCETPSCTNGVCGLAQDDGICAGAYSSCANAVCSGNVQGADANGCTIADQATSAATCTATLGGLQCGTYMCSSDAAAANSGCSVSPDDSACAMAGTCLAQTCSATGTCTADEAASNANCAGAYSVCANAVCDPNAEGADTNGCNIDFPANSAATCAATLGALECGTYVCSSDASAANSGCSVSPDDSACAMAGTCLAQTCSNTGTCTTDEAASNANCENVFGNCVQPKCDPTGTLASSTGCVPGAEIENVCTLPAGAECGTATCNSATGVCDVNGDAGTQCNVGGQTCECSGFKCGCCAVDTDCGDCETCDAGVCKPTCGTCEVCNGGTCAVASEGSDCDMGGADCICTGSDTGRDCECLAACPAVATPGDCSSAAAKCAVSSARNKENNSNCGNACVLLCQTQCGGDASLYSSNDCSSATCSCAGSISPFNNEPITGNCCKCNAC